ncbi:MAG: YidC/Oxa1 family membrane protein insertase, partial [Patescibacteria group bacterium]
RDFFTVILYQPLFNLLTFFSFLVPGHSIGWGIILLTIFIRLALWLPQNKALKAPLLMRQYADEIKAIQERFKDDRAAQSQAMLAFYREKGVNPLSGCLPLLIQLPILIVLYQVFIAGLHQTRQDLLYSFTPHQDSVNSLFLGIDLARPEPWILPITAALIQFFQSRQMMKMNPPTVRSKDDPMAMMNKQMLYLFPIMTLFISRTLPAGLALYWAASGLVSIIQQYLLVKTFRPPAASKVIVRRKE